MDRAQRKAALKAWQVLPRDERGALLRTAAAGRPLKSPERGRVLLGWAAAWPLSALWPGLLNVAALGYLISQLGSASGGRLLAAATIACVSAGYLAWLVLELLIATRVRRNRRLYESSAPPAATVLPTST